MSKIMLCLKHLFKQSVSLWWSSLRGHSRKWKTWLVTFVHEVRQWLYITDWLCHNLPLPKFLWANKTIQKWKSEVFWSLWITSEYGGGGLACSVVEHRADWIRATSMYMVDKPTNRTLVFLRVWWFSKTGIEASIQCLVLVLEKLFAVMPCINPLSIVRYTMGDESLPDHLFRLKKVK